MSLSRRNPSHNGRVRGKIGQVEPQPALSTSISTGVRSGASESPSRPSACVADY
jgi:hypothetical protein